MATLVPSLKALFRELDATWPNRDHRTDGWIGDRKHCPGSSDHCADSQGRVHAIDIDKDGIDADYVVGRLRNYKGVVRYINWNRKQYHVRNNYAPKPLGGDNPHTDHIHVSIEHTDRARNYTSGYGIKGTGKPKDPSIPVPQDPNPASYDSTGHIRTLGSSFYTAGNSLSGYASSVAGLRS